MSRQAVATAENFKPRNVTIVMWALATLGVQVDAYLAAVLSARAISLAGEFKPQEVANLMWALATLGIEPESGLVKAMSNQAVSIAGEFTPQNVANLLWALAVLSVCAEKELVGAMLLRAVACLDDLTTQGATNVLWALAVLGAEADPTAAGAVAARAVEAAGELDCRELSQLHQVLLAAELEGLFRGLDLAELVGPSLAERCRGAFEGAAVSGSKLQAAVARCLAGLGVPFEEEAIEPRTGYRVDMLVTAQAPAGGGGTWGPCVVEVDGPKHFVAKAGGGGGWRPNGSTLLKRRLLAQAGWRVVSLPFWELDSCAGQEAQAAYLRRRLCD
jgi:hypothetical protein